MHRFLAVTVVALIVLIAAPGHASSLRSGDILALTDDGVIIRIDPITGAKATVASGGLMMDTTGITATELGDVFVVQSGDTIVQISPVTGEQNVVSQGGFLRFSRDVTADRDGNLFLPSFFQPCPGLLARTVIHVDPRTGGQSLAFAPDCATGHYNGNDDRATLFLPFEIETAPDEVSLVLLDSGLSGSDGGFVLVDPAAGSGRFRVGPFNPTELAVAPDGDLIIRSATEFGGPRQLVLWDSTLLIPTGVLSTPRDYLFFDIAPTGDLIGIAQASTASAELYRLDLRTGVETFLASLPANVTNMTLVPAVSVRADSFIRTGAPNTNEGASPRLRIEAAGHNRALVGFDLSGLTRSAVARATLVLTIAENGDNWGRNDVRTVEAHPLITGFTEGNGKDAGIRARDGVRGRGPGVTWSCASDAEIANRRPDCRSQWRGGDFGPATAPPVVHSNGQTGEVAWDVTADVQAGVSGWLIKKTKEAASGRVTYYSKEGAQEAQNPVLAPRLLLEWR